MEDTYRDEGAAAATQQPPSKIIDSASQIINEPAPVSRRLPSNNGGQVTLPRIAVVLLTALYLLALRGCYDLVPAGAAAGTAYRLNRLTGGAAFCVPGDGCHSLKEKQP